MTLRKRKVLCKRFILRIIMILIVQILCIISVGSSGYITAGEINKNLRISEDSEIFITISDNYEDEETVSEAEKKVLKYLQKYDFEYKSPEQVIFGDITPDYIYGCEQDDVIYIDIRSKNEMLSTIVHELLHLQNPVGFDSETEFGTIGHNLTEAVVEKMTIEITNQPETKRTQLLTTWTTECTYQMMCKAFFEHRPNVLEDILNDNQLHKVVYLEKEYLVSTAEYFKISFDKWMIVENGEEHFGKLKMEKEP